MRAGWGWPSDLPGSRGWFGHPLGPKPKNNPKNLLWVLALGGGQTTPCGPMGWSKPPPTGPWGWLRPPPRAKTQKYPKKNLLVLTLGGSRTTSYGLIGWSNPPSVALWGGRIHTGWPTGGGSATPRGKTHKIFFWLFLGFGPRGG
jgi:hypothetical protein